MFKGEVTILNEAHLCNIMKLDMDLWYIYFFMLMALTLSDQMM